MTQFNDLEVKRQITVRENAPKLGKKEQQLLSKSNNITSKMGEIDLEKINAEDRADTLRDELLAHAEKAYQASIKFAQEQHKRMLEKAQRIFESKKRVLESRADYVKEEMGFVSEVKTAPEIALDKQQQKILREMEDIRKSMIISRKDVTAAGYIDKLQPIPELPAKLIEVEKTPPSTPITVPALIENFFTEEELELQQLRKEETFRINLRQQKEEEAKQYRKERQHMEALISTQRYNELVARVNAR